VVYVGPDGAVRRANPAALAFLGYSYDALTHRYTQDFAGETWLESGQRCEVADYPVTQTLTTGEPAGPRTIGVQQPDGEVRWAVFRAVPVEQGGAIVTFLDITERRAREEHLRRSDRLASLGRLAAGVAHEINNPLTWVMLHLERALERDDPSPAIGEALTGLQRVAGIVRDLNALARIDPPEAVAFDIHESIEQALAICRPEARHRTRLQFCPGPDLPPAFAVPDQVVQIVLNLVLNAVQSIAPGARDDNLVSVHTERVGPQVEVRVTDTGPGMAEHVRDHALDPFFTTKEPGEGMGLGLAISHALTDAMQGELHIDSQLGRGTTVRLRLPRAQASPPAPVAVDDRPASRRGRVLVVDDEPQIVQLLAWALDAHEVTTASDGRQALSQVRDHTPDVIVCDLMMPEVTGMMLHEILAAEHPELLDRIVFLTGGAYTAAAQAFVERDDVVCLTKPFSVAEVRALVDEAMPRSAGASPH